MVLSGKRNRLDKPGIIIYVAGVCLLCWIIGFFTSLGYPIHPEAHEAPLWGYICRMLPGKLATYLIGAVLMLGSAFLLYRVNYALGLIREKTLLPFLLFILLLSSNHSFFPLKSTSVGVFCLILALYLLFVSYHNPEAKNNAFKIGVILGIGSLLWVHILWAFPLFWAGMYRFRLLNPKTFTASLLGLLTILWLLLGWCVWQEDYTPFTVPAASLLEFKLLSVTNFEWLNGIGLLYMVILVLISSIQILTHEHEDSLRTRQFLYFLMIFGIGAFILFLLYNNTHEEFLHALCVPASILIAHFFTICRKRIVFWLFLFTILFYPTLLLAYLWNSL